MEFLVRTVFEPLAHRVGSLIGGALVALGATQEQSAQVIAALLAIASVGFDLLLKWRRENRKVKIE